MYLLLHMTKEKLNEVRFRHVTLRQLRVLAALAEKGKLRAAAASLNVTAPAITQQLALLEAAAGLPLFVRSREGFRLTDAGHHLLGAHARIETALRDAATLCDDIRGLGRGQVTLGAVSTAKYLAPGLVAAFLAERPSIDVQITVGNRAAILSTLDRLDLAIMGNPPPSPDIERRVLGSHPHVIVAPAGHALTRRRRVAATDLSREVMIQREPGSGTRALMERTFATLGIAPASFRQFGSNETTKQAVIAGLGLAFVSAHTVSVELKAGLLAVVPVDGLPVVREWFAVRLRGRQHTHASTATWDFLTARGLALLPDLSALVIPDRKRKRAPARDA